MSLLDSSAQIDAFLGRQPWYVQLPAAWRQEVRASVYCLHGERGETLLQAGELSHSWCAVLNGFVLLQMRRDGGPAFSYLALTAAEWFGEGSTMEEARRTYDVVALRRCTLLCVPGSLFRRLLAASTAFSNTMLTNVHRRLAQTMSIIELHRTGTPERRVALYLSTSFWHGLRTLDLTQEELGALAGVSRQTVNTALRKLAEQGLITLTHGRVARVNVNGIDRFVRAIDLQTEMAEPPQRCAVGAMQIAA